MTRAAAIDAVRAAGDQTPYEDIDALCEYIGISRSASSPSPSASATRTSGPGATAWQIDDFLDPRLTERPAAELSDVRDRGLRRPGPAERGARGPHARADGPPRAGPRRAPRLRPGERPPRRTAAHAAVDHRPRPAREPAVAVRRQLARVQRRALQLRRTRRGEAAGARRRTPRCCARRSTGRRGGARALRGHVGLRLHDERRPAAALRDRFGEKPLFLLRDPDGGLYFGSEPKFLFALAGRVPPVEPPPSAALPGQRLQGAVQDRGHVLRGARAAPARPPAGDRRRR